MNRLTEQEIQAAFEKLRLATEMERAEFVRYSKLDVSEENQEFIRLDNTTQIVETGHAKLA